MRGPDQDEAVARLWDELSAFDAAEAAAAQRHLMGRIAAMVGAVNVTWVGSMRTADDPADSLHGWRIGAVAYLRDEPMTAAAVAQMKTMWAKREADPLSLHCLPRPEETMRIFSSRQAMAPAWFDSDYFRLFYQARGIYDTVHAVFSVNSDAVSAFVVHADEKRGDFTDEDIALVGRILRGIRWFHLRLMLGYGLMVASAPLTPAERRVLSELLTERPEKEIARRLDLAPSTVHQYAVALCRKFGVKGRAGLMSLWLNGSG